jgi:hypothetical protein
MSALEKIAFFLNRRDEVPNQELAHQLASSQDTAGIAEIAENLWNKNSNISSDCLKVLYEIGYIKPELSAPYVSDFLKLLTVKDNRKVWGSMIALGTIAHLHPAEISAQIDTVIATTQKGSVITLVWGVRVLSAVLSKIPSLQDHVLPVLLHILETCLPRDIPTHTESMLPCINPGNKSQELSIIDSRWSECSPAQQTRLKKVLKAVNAIG